MMIIMSFKLKLRRKDMSLMILASEESIREVIPFPKTTSALDLMANSPSGVTDRLLEELGL